MKAFTIYKRFVMDGANEVLSIMIKQHSIKDQWKNRYMIFHDSTTTYRKEKQQWLKQQKQK